MKVDWLTLITACVAVYGAILSTYNLLIKRKENRRQVNVTLKWGVRMDNQNTIFCLEAANPGKRPVTLEGCYIELPNKKQLIWPDDWEAGKFPHDLAEGKKLSVWYPITEVVEALITEGFPGDISICAVFKDALGGKYKSIPFKGDVSEWSKIK